MSLSFDIPKESKFTADGIYFDSQEEVEFYHWCKEAEAHGYIKDFLYHAESYPLSDRVAVQEEKMLKTKVKTVEKFLLHPHEYTPDFIIYPTEKFLEFDHDLRPYFEMIFIDVKGGFGIYHNQREFSINQKWMYSKYGIFVNKVVPEKFFKRTWVPAAATVSPKKKTARKKYAGFRRVNNEIELQF